MVLRVRPTPARFPTNSLYTPVDKHTLAFYIKCVPPVGRKLSFQEESAYANSYISRHIVFFHHPLRGPQARYIKMKYCPNRHEFISCEHSPLKGAFKGSISMSLNSQITHCYTFREKWEAPSFKLLHCKAGVRHILPIAWSITSVFANACPILTDTFRSSIIHSHK